MIQTLWSSWPGLGTNTNPHTLIQSTHQIEADLISLFPRIKFHFAWCPWLVCLCACMCVNLRVSACLPGESCPWVMRADGSPWIRFGGAGKHPAVGRTLTHLRGHCCWAFDQEHQHDGIRDGAVIWNGSALWLLCMFLCLHICVCPSFSGHQVGCGASDFLLAKHLYSVPCNFPATISGQGDITSNPSAHISYCLCSTPFSPAQWSELNMNWWLIWMSQSVP